ncbi:hypothetical protein ACLKA6_013883 [Drosophila palustris]
MGAMLQQAVRFLTMTPQQFAEGPARSKLLQQHEALAMRMTALCRRRELTSSYRMVNNSSNPNSCFPTGTTGPRAVAYPATNLPLFTRQQRISVPLQLGAAMDASAVGGGFFITDEASPPACHIVQGPRFADSYDGPGPGPGVKAEPELVPGPGPGPHPAPGGNDNEVAAPSISFHDMTRSYCVCSMTRQFDFRNTSVTDAGVTFQLFLEGRIPIEFGFWQGCQKVCRGDRAAWRQPGQEEGRSQSEKGLMAHSTLPSTHNNNRHLKCQQANLHHAKAASDVQSCRYVTEDLDVAFL